MRCIVIDDEPYALDLIKSYILKTPFLELIESFTNPFKALSFLQSNNIDLAFLDINMPELTGLQLVKSLTSPPEVIFITAYPEFGAESYEFNAVDYLLKPVKYDRFLKAVNKVSFQPKDVEKKKSSQTVFIKSGTQINQIQVDNIQYIEAAGNYMTFYTTHKKLLSLFNMKEVLDLLPSDEFIRIHKSFIVSLGHIDIIEKHRVIINEQAIPIGVTYREEFLKRFESKK
ncbi:MAG: response regulator transcription factor [Bacteroidetes bacterium]|jgi:two-component system, LytTR family, response regulator|nr:response regulator transcription factor [Bacteroidota bacterium]MBT4397983.1 response regulator transcription factor [Bacteroidota bacterium]MBT4412279.1 response regulator transcription factor [Bacteroidota bacterium]MBT5427394.1 response regulator transcription factor [Bacteroidota bacterium]MBT7463471.1 response regulator transcription factor [Bacteroidota bacterium]